MIHFYLHLSERTMRELLADPETPDKPTFADFRAALRRADERKSREQSPTPKD